MDTSASVPRVRWRSSAVGGVAWSSAPDTRWSSSGGRRGAAALDNDPDAAPGSIPQVAAVIGPDRRLAAPRTAPRSRRRAGRARGRPFLALAGGQVSCAERLPPAGLGLFAGGGEICEEQPREGYDRDAFGSAYSSLEDDIIDMLPPTMKAGGQVYTPYSCLAFEIRADGTAATDIEHIVALAEAHDSRIDDDQRRDIAADLDNLTIADSRVNRTEKSDRDAGQWTPARHGAWFAAQVIAVKLEYGLSVDPAERAALEALLAGGGAQLSCVDADTTSPAVAISSDASAPVTGPFSIAIAFSEPVTGFELEDLVVGNGSASELQGNNATYTVTITPDLRHRNGGHRGRRVAGQRRQPERGGRPVLDRRGPDPGAGSAMAGAIALAVLLLVGGVRRWAAS